MTRPRKFHVWTDDFRPVCGLTKQGQFDSFMVTCLRCLLIKAVRARNAMRTEVRKMIRESRGAFLSIE